MKNHISKTLVILILAFLLPAICIGAEVTQKDLGVRNASFSSTGQALAMLSLLNEKPHQLKYQISYKTEVDQVVFEYDAGADSLTRIRKQKDGTGTVEKLQGEAMFRLQAAAKGGSLFDTSKGQSVGTVENF